MNDERSGGFLLHDLVLIRFEEKRIAVGEWDVAAHRIDLVCVNSGHDRLHAVRTAIAVGIGTVEQGNMVRRFGKLDLLEDGLPYVGGGTVGASGSRVGRVTANRLGISADPP